LCTRRASAISGVPARRRLSRSGRLTCGSVRWMERTGDRVELAALVAAVSLAADLASGVTLEHGLRCPYRRWCTAR